MTSGKSANNVIKKTLSNGLTVLLKEDRSNPVVAINVWFGVGSANESEKESGLAHFQEHMVFKGTERHGVGQIANIVKSAGGNLNAGTSYSYTMYYVVLPSKAFSLGLDVQADAMMNSTFDPDEFRKERLVVIDEARMYDDTPDSFTFYRTMELGYQVHNYRRPIAGYEKVVREFTREQLLGFYRRYYRPGNSVLVVVGDVDAKSAMAEIERVYGGWQNGKISVGESPAEPPQTEFRYKAMKGSIDHAYLGAGFHVPSMLDPDYPALEMLSTLIGAGRSSRLHRRVLEDKHLVTTVSADLLAEKWPGYFMLFASTPGDKWEAARDAIFEELARFQHEPVAEDELMKARRQVEKSMYSELETVEGQASNLGYYELLGDYRLAEQHRDAIRRVTSEEVMAVARKYFTMNNCSLVSYLPETVGVKEPSPESVRARLVAVLEGAPTGAGAHGATAKTVSKTRSRSKAATKPKRPTPRAAGGVPAVRMLTLDNGLKLLVKRRVTVPMVSMLTIIQGGTRLEPPGRSGLSVLAMRGLLKGTRSHTDEAIVNTIAALGGNVETFASFDVTGAYVNVLSEHLGGAVPVYREILREPTFARDKIEKEKSKLLKELAKRHDHPVYYSIDNLFANAFGDHPYAHPFIGDESQLATLTDEDCRSWYRTTLVPGNMVMVFVGDITEERAYDVATAVFGDLKEGKVPAPHAAPPVAPAHPGLRELKRAHLKQGVGLVGYLAPPMMSKEAIALRVLNGVMTGLGGRLFVELRDKRSLGYMTGSSLMALKERSILYGYANPGPEGVQEALDVIVAELERVTREPVTDEELTRSKEWLSGSQVMSLQRNLSQAMEYGVYEALGFGYGIVDRTAEIIQGVSKEDILNAARTVFTSDNAVFIKLMPAVEEEAARE